MPVQHRMLCVVYVVAETTLYSVGVRLIIRACTLSHLSQQGAGSTDCVPPACAAAAVLAGGAL